jgi:hypothetical protein
MSASNSTSRSASVQNASCWIPPHFLLTNGLEYVGWKSGTRTRFSFLARNWCSQSQVHELASALNRDLAAPIWKVVPLHLKDLELPGDRWIP